MSMSIMPMRNALLSTKIGARYASPPSQALIIRNNPSKQAWFEELALKLEAATSLPEFADLNWHAGIDMVPFEARTIALCLKRLNVHAGIEVVSFDIKSVGFAL